MTDMKEVCLRPHHGLCVRFYAGKGYSREFVNNMNMIVGKLKDNPEITLVLSSDVLCSCCPNNDSQAGCKSIDKVNGYDTAVLLHTGLSAGDKIKWEYFQSLLTEKIFNTDIFDQICPDCQWSEICHK